MLQCWRGANDLSHIHSSAESPHYCLFVCPYFCSNLCGIYALHVRLKKTILYLLLFFHTHKEKISRRGTLQWISVLTQVIAFLLGSLRVLIQLDKVCSLARESGSFIWAPDLCFWQDYISSFNWNTERRSLSKWSGSIIFWGEQEKKVPRLLL